MSFFPRRLEFYLNVIDEDNAFPEIRVWSKPSYTTVTTATCSNDDPHAAHRYLLEVALTPFSAFVTQRHTFTQSFSSYLTQRANSLPSHSQFCRRSLNLSGRSELLKTHIHPAWVSFSLM
ncbi:hypothetical protein AX14_000828 [Amanita brunnescens Koide BX004]|nr:hypothetical protein AX14_000828 [Amanita brunnescens Koide BX004]